jgi:hypothetical protein
MYVVSSHYQEFISASGSCSAGQGSSEPVVPRIFYSAFLPVYFLLPVLLLACNKDELPTQIFFYTITIIF